MVPMGAPWNGGRIKATWAVAAGVVMAVLIAGCESIPSSESGSRLGESPAALEATAPFPPAQDVAAGNRPVGLVLSVSIPDTELPAGTEQTATVTMTNESRSVLTVADFFGVSVADGNGTIIGDTFGGHRPNYPTVFVDLAAGSSRSHEFRFHVPPPGRYRIAGYLMDETTWTPAVEFASTGSR